MRSPKVESFQLAVFGFPTGMEQAVGHGTAAYYLLSRIQKIPGVSVLAEALKICGKLA